MTIITTILILILRFFTDSDPPKDNDKPNDTPETDEKDEEKWATREQLNTFRSSVESRLDSLTEMLTGGDSEEPEHKRRTLITPSAEDDELTTLDSTLPENPTQESELESLATQVPKRKRAIWEKNPPMQSVQNASIPDDLKPT